MRSGVSGWSRREHARVVLERRWVSKVEHGGLWSPTRSSPLSLSGGTASTGQWAMCSRRCVTPPSSSPARGVRPRVPTTMTSACSCGGELGDRVSGVSDLAARLRQRRPRTVARELRDLLLDLRLDFILVGVDREAPAALARERELLAVDDRHRSAALGGERLGMGQRAVGGLGAVGCPQTCLYMACSLFRCRLVCGAWLEICAGSRLAPGEDSGYVER